MIQNELAKFFYISSSSLFPVLASGASGWRRINKCLAVEGMKESHLPFIPCFILGKMSICVGIWHGRAKHSPAKAVCCLCSVIRSSPQVILEAAFTLWPQRIFSQRSRRRVSIWPIGKGTPRSERGSCRAAREGCDVFVR